MAIFTAAVEGTSDVPVIQKVLAYTGHELGYVHGRKGKGFLDQNLNGYNNAAKHAPWLVVRDLDRDAPCPSELLARLLPQPSRQMLLRIAVHEIEAWLLADATKLARFLGIETQRVPDRPDRLDNPKATMLDLAARSKSRAIRDDMVRDSASGRAVGPAYVSRIAEFATKHWRPDVAMVESDSLRRCIVRLRAWAP